MRFLCKEQLSEHKYKTPEGYLVCVDSILARTGAQTYLRKEVFGDSCENADEQVSVMRNEKEVFDERAIASFENKPIAIEHPDENINPENHKDYSVGFVRDVHRGERDGEQVLLGTLVITDQEGIDAIESGKYQQLSCGYDCDIEDVESPEQRNIRGNHVALCEQGRAGIARIVDSVDDYRMPSTTRRQFKSTDISEEKDIEWGTPKGSAYVYFDKNEIVYEPTYSYSNEKEIHKFNSLNALNKWLLSDSIIDSQKIFKILETDSTFTRFLERDASRAGFKTERNNQYGEIYLYIIGEESRVRDFLTKQDLRERYNYKIVKSTYDSIDSGEEDMFVKDGFYNPYEKENDKSFLKEAIKEMRRYESNWSFMSSREKRDIAPTGGLKELRENIKFAEKRLKELNDSIDDQLEGLIWFVSGHPGKWALECVAKNNLYKEFDTKEEAIEYAKKNGLKSTLTDSIHDVNPREGESKEDFISRFMSETKEEYPDEKQRLAVAYSYWEKSKKVEDAVKTYQINWIDTYSKSKGYTKLEYAHRDEIKASSLNEAFEKLAKKVALSGIGTANTLITSFRTDNKVYQFSGRLSDLLKQHHEDSVDDEDKKVKDIHSGYVIVLKRNWEKFKQNAYIEAAAHTLDEAQYVRSSLEKNDRMSFVIIDGGKQQIVDSVNDSSFSKYVDQIVKSVFWYNGNPQDDVFDDIIEYLETHLGVALNEVDDDEKMKRELKNYLSRCTLQRILHIGYMLEKRYHRPFIWDSIDDQENNSIDSVKDVDFDKKVCLTNTADKWQFIKYCTAHHVDVFITNDYSTYGLKGKKEDINFVLTTFEPLGRIVVKDASFDRKVYLSNTLDKWPFIEFCEAHHVVVWTTGEYSTYGLKGKKEDIDYVLKNFDAKGRIDVEKEKPNEYSKKVYLSNNTLSRNPLIAFCEKHNVKMRTTREYSVYELIGKKEDVEYVIKHFTPPSGRFELWDSADSVKDESIRQFLNKDKRYLVVISREWDENKLNSQAYREFKTLEEAKAYKLRGYKNGYEFDVLEIGDGKFRIIDSAKDSILKVNNRLYKIVRK